MNDSWTILDSQGSVLSVGDCVERVGQKYAVMGLMDICGEDIVVLGELVGGKLARPWAERADWLKKVEI